MIEIVVEVTFSVFLRHIFFTFKTCIYIYCNRINLCYNSFEKKMQDLELEVAK